MPLPFHWSLEPNTLTISFTLGDNPWILPLPCTLYLPPWVINGCLSVRQMFRTLGLAKINANVPNAAASGMFLEHFFFSTRQNGELWVKKGLIGTNKSFQLFNLITTLPLFFGTYHFMHFLCFHFTCKYVLCVGLSRINNMFYLYEIWFLIGRLIKPSDLKLRFWSQKDLPSLFLWP